MRVLKPAGRRLNAAMLGPNFIETVWISKVADEKCGEDRKPVLYFEGHDRGLPLNSTNIDVLTSLFGSDESDHWIGRSVQIYTTSTRYQGKDTLGIRIRGAHGDGRPDPVAAERTLSASAAPPPPAGPRVVPPAGRQPGDDDGPVVGPMRASDIRW